MKRISKRPFLFIFSLTAVLGFSESFRVRKLIPVEISAEASNEHVIMTGINDSVAIYFPEDKTYLEGVKLKLSIPANVAEWRDAVAFSIYDNVLPKPVSSQIDYSGTKIFVTPVPAKLSWNILIPIAESNSIKDGSYNTTKINIIPDIKKNYTFLRFQPAMKGIPEETYDAEIKITVEPILIDKGRLVLNLTTWDNGKKPYSVFIDGTAYQSEKKDFLLDTGMHTLNIQSEDYRSEARSVFIEQAKDTAIDIRLQSIEPVLTVSAPQNAAVFLDDEKLKVNESEKIISEGEHSLKCQIGDYELQRKITVQKGKSYTVNLSVDLQVTEE